MKPMKPGIKKCILLGGLACAMVVVVALSWNHHNLVSRQTAIQQYFAAQHAQVPPHTSLVERSTLLPGPATTRTISAAADLIARGSVVEVGSATRDSHGLAQHVVRIQLNDVIKQPKRGGAEKIVTVAVYGGIIGSDYYTAEDAPVFTQGEDVVVFLTKGENGYFVTYEGYGKLTVTNGTVAGVSDDRGLIHEPYSVYRAQLSALSQEK